MLGFFRTRDWNFKNEPLSGHTVALVPEAVAFAFVAGVSPIIGLYSALFIGLIADAVGGRPGMISGATGAMAAIIVLTLGDMLLNNARDVVEVNLSEGPQHHLATGRLC